MPEVLTMWKDHVATFSEKASKSLANPDDYKNLFPKFEQSLVDEANREGGGGGGVTPEAVKAKEVVEEEPVIEVTFWVERWLNSTHVFVMN
jgi:hypothetical protein